MLCKTQKSCGRPPEKSGSFAVDTATATTKPVTGKNKARHHEPGQSLEFQLRVGLVVPGRPDAQMRIGMTM
jgi:hypothetical protein